MDYDRLLKQLIVDEALKLKPYKCTAGKVTIGIGRNLDDRGITAEEAMYLAKNDIVVCESELDKNIPWWRKLTPLRQEVLVNMCFNLGWPRLSGFKNTLALVQAGRYDEASREMLNSAWARQVGARATRLSEMMKRG